MATADAPTGAKTKEPDCAGGSVGPRSSNRAAIERSSALFAIEPVPVAPYACGAYDDPGVRRAESVAKENPSFGKERVLPVLGGARQQRDRLLQEVGLLGSRLVIRHAWGRPKLQRPSRSSLSIAWRLGVLARPQDPLMLLSQRAPRLCIARTAAQAGASRERVPGTVTAADRSRPSGSSARSACDSLRRPVQAQAAPAPRPSDREPRSE